MIRRTFLSFTALLMTGGLAFAQAKRTVPPQPLRGPLGDLPAREVFDFQQMVTRAMAAATRVEREAEQMLREFAARAFNQLEIPSVSLRELPPGRAPSLYVSQLNFPTLLFAVLEAGKTAEGQIIVTRDAVAQSLKDFCPLYPFC